MSETSFAADLDAAEAAREVVETAPEQRFIPSLPTLDPALLLPTLDPPRAPLFPLDRLASEAGGAHLFYLARAGVYHAVRAYLSRSPVSDGNQPLVLMPAYHHGVEVEAVRATGARVMFYRVDQNMRVDLDDLASRMGDKDVRLVYLTHYIGFQQPVDQVKALCHQRGLPLVEDCALSLLSRDVEGRPLGSLGDAAVFCLYKTLPVPHGGLLLAPGLPAPPVPEAPPLASTLHHAAGLVLAHLELTSGEVGKRVRALARSASRSTVDNVVDTVKTGTQHLSQGDLTWGCAPMVSRLLPRFDLEMVVVRRRRNFRRLAEQLRDRLPVIGDPLPPGVCPLFLPVRVHDKRALVEKLHARGIDAIDFWNASDRACSDEEFPEVAQLRREVMELPCHQALDDEAIDFVARVVKDELQNA